MFPGVRGRCRGTFESAKMALLTVFQRFTSISIAKPVTARYGAYPNIKCKRADAR